MKSVKVKDLDANEAVNYDKSALTVGVVRDSSRTEINRFALLYRKALDWALDDSESTEYATLKDKILSNVDKAAHPSRVAIDPSKLPFKVEDQGTYPISIEIEDGANTLTVNTTVLVAALPSDASWSPADLHLHSTWSDGNFTPYDLRVNLQNKGYKILYFTDHVNLVQDNGGWAPYSADVTAASSSTLACYPGAEETVLNNGSVGGDLLAYGVNSLLNIANKTYEAQVAINNVHSNNPGISSPSIAHPTASTSWANWTVSGYKGFELMSGVQYAFGDTASPMVRWRSEQDRCMTNSSYPPSARTGSDYHGNLGDPVHAGYVTWVRTGQWNSKSAVDSALYQASTVASKLGGLGYLTMTYSGTKNAGATFTAPSLASIPYSVTFKPAVSGTYTITIYCDNEVSTVGTPVTASYTAGGTYTPLSVWPPYSGENAPLANPRAALRGFPHATNGWAVTRPSANAA